MDMHTRDMMVVALCCLGAMLILLLWLTGSAFPATLQSAHASAQSAHGWGGIC